MSEKLSIERRLAAHAAAFWGESSDEEDSVTNLEASSIIDDMRSESEQSSNDNMISDDDNDGYNYKLNVSKPVPVVVYNPTYNSKTSQPPSSGLPDYKRFMSAKISKLRKESVPNSTIPTSTEEQEEAKNTRHDRELQDLLKTSKLIEQYAAEELYGRDRQKYQLKKLEELGVKSDGAVKMPLRHKRGMIVADEKRKIKALQQAKELGLYHPLLKSRYSSAEELVRNATDKTKLNKVIHSSGNRKKIQVGVMKKAERGLKIGFGKFKDGVLNISKGEIRRATHTTLTRVKARINEGPKGSSRKKGKKTKRH